MREFPVFVVGTRAQLIKVAPVLVACQRRQLAAHLIMTGQHYETMQDLIDEFGISTPISHAIVGREHATVGSLLRWLPAAYSGLVRGLSDLSRQHGPLSVVVHGDTLSTVVGAVAAKRTRNSVVHLESGLTSGRIWDPFPEELSRRVVFRMTDVAFCPNEAAATQMRQFRSCAAINTNGNTIVDAVRLSGPFRKWQSADRPYVVASLHRFQNLFNSARLEYLVAAIEEISQAYLVHFVLHPATRKRLESTGLLSRLQSHPAINLSPRLGYKQFINLAAGADCVLTDGGSNQEELAALGVPTIIMRETTERPDGLGRNAIMEGMMGCGAARYVMERRFESLRRSRELQADLGPSDLIARVLAGQLDPKNGAQ